MYGTWVAIYQRCHVGTDAAFPWYGGRGIGLFEAWRADFPAFAAWVDANLGPRPEGHTLDRVDVERGYEPGNLAWATPVEQTFNRRGHCPTCTCGHG